MAALLYKECEDLIFLAERSGLTEMIDEVSNWKKQISEEYGKTWDPESSQFRYRDSLTHHSPKGVILIDRYGPGTYFSKKTLGHAQSLVMKTIIAKEETRSFIINIEGEDDISRISEKFTSSNFTWSQGYAVLNTQRAYTKVTRFEVNGISDQDRIILSTIDYTQSDITQLIAIWANIGTEDQQQKIIKKFLIQNNIQNYGIPLVQPRFRPRGMPFVEDVHLPLNLLIGEGLVRTGNRKAAARLMERILNGISNNLKDYGNFREYFNASDRKPSGARNHLCGLVPISLLLEITGIDFSSSKEVVVEGLYPFSFPITVKYAGITVTRDKKRTLVNWPHCEPVVLTGPGPHKVTLEPI
jgi:hypothetical protein